MAFNSAFISWSNELSDKSEGRIITIDGKTSRRSHDKEINKKAIHIVNAWVDENDLILGQLKTSEKSNEITAIPELLDLFFIKGSIITIDSMDTQKIIAKKIIEKEAECELFSKSVRNHWDVESCHWILDVVFREDNSRVRKMAELFHK